MIYFLSDAHLGSRAIDNPAVHQTKVVELLQRMGKDATAIYLLGDMFDFWYEYLWHDGSKAQYTPFLNCLRGLTEKGVEVHYFTGNHDIWTFGWLERKTGITVHREPLETTLCGKTVYMAHGDGLIPSSFMTTLPKEMHRKIQAFMRLRAFFHNPIAQACFRLLPPAAGNAFGYEWARRSRMKEIANPCLYKGEDKEELVLFAKEMPPHDYFIFGHRHIELDLMIRQGSRVIILGDMFRQWTYARMDEKGELFIESDI